MNRNKTRFLARLAKLIADDYGVELIETPVGFKFIGEKIKQLDDTGLRKFIFGFEESYGYLRGTYARDKDAVVASMLACQMAADYKARGMTLYEGLINLYDKYGCYMERTMTKTFAGIDGAEQIKGIMEKFRSNPITEVGDVKVSQMWDVKEGTVLYADGTKKGLDLPSSNVLKYIFEDNVKLEELTTKLITISGSENSDV